MKQYITLNGLNNPSKRIKLFVSRPATDIPSVVLGVMG